jgi:hypothetical protein
MPARGRNRAVDSPVWYRAGRWFSYSELTGAYLAHITFEAYRVVRRTPEGVWLDVGMPKLRWVSTGAMKRFAYPRKSMALTNLRHRAQSYVRHCNTRVAQANATVQALHTYQLEELTDAT